MMGANAASVIAVPTDRFVDGRMRNNGLHGFGNTIAITPDGTVNPAFRQATDVTANAFFVAFKTGTDANTTLGYIKLK